jgi:hypothetical protein
MRKALNILTCMVAIGLYAPGASAMKLTFDDSLWTGWFDPCASGKAAAKLACIDGLITLAPNRGGTLASPTTGIGSHEQQTDANRHGTGHDVGGFEDLLAQYGVAGHPWLSVGLTGTIPANTTISPNFASAQQLMSSAGVAAGAAAVPDGGATGALLGLGLLAIRLVNFASRKG